MFDFNTVTKNATKFCPPMAMNLNTCVAGNSTHVYIFGLGRNKTEVWVNSEASSITKWVQVRDDFPGSIGMACLMYDKKIYVTGGGKGDNRTWIVDMNTNTFSPLGNLTVGRTNHRMAVWNGKVAVLGGGYDLGTGWLHQLRSIETYDPFNNTWTVDAHTLNTARGQFGLDQLMIPN